jgi:GMP synthase (glutamine-hydrolysing)
VASLLVIKSGTTLASIAARRRDYDTWIITGTGFAVSDVQVVNVFQNEALPPPNSVQGVVLSGSSAMVTDREPWSERTAEWIRELVSLERPLLGICYGHQLLAQAMGGRVDYNPRGRHIGTVDVTLRATVKDDRLFDVFQSPMHVPVCHRQCVLELPPGATWLAEAAMDPHHAFRIGARAWGVQFHPEFDAGVVRSYIDVRRDELAKEGLDAGAIWENAIDSADGTLLLRRFAEIVRRSNTRAA